jgi:hypothetical protein
MEEEKNETNLAAISRMVLDRLKSSETEVVSFHKSIDSIKKENNRLKETINAVKE